MVLLMCVSCRLQGRANLLQDVSFFCYHILISRSLFHEFHNMVTNMMSVGLLFKHRVCNKLIC